MKSTSPDIKIEFGQGSPMYDITDLVTSDLPIKNEGITVDATPYGTKAVVNAFVGMTNPPDLTLSMLFDDDDQGSMDLFDEISSVNTADYTLKVTWTVGSPATYSTWICGIRSFEIMGKVKDVTRVNVTLTSRGPITHYRQGV